jgi:acetyl-CoA carboxylase carboxyl transferase subunit beta
MPSWWRIGRKAPRPQPKQDVPDGVWLKCGGCSEILYRKELERNCWVCRSCGHHFRILPNDYIQLVTDPQSFEQLFGGVRSLDPLGFRDSKKYTDRLKAATKKDPSAEAVITGLAAIDGRRVALAVMDFSFMGGSMGSVVGERISRLMALAREERIPLIIFSCSGGARMQEGALSLMQLAKTCAQLAWMDEDRVPFISVLTDPTTGGVTASYASLGDIIIAEPNALIGFAGPRVIEQTINQELPPGFQRAEFLLEHGMIDMIVPRTELRERLSTLVSYFYDSGSLRSRVEESGAGSKAAESREEISLERTRVEGTD